MPHARVSTRRVVSTLHHACCAGVAVGVAAAVRAGDPRTLPLAVLGLCGSLALTFVRPAAAPDRRAAPAPLSGPRRC
jgi:hypothetical protein